MTSPISPWAASTFCNVLTTLGCRGRGGVSRVGLQKLASERLESGLFDTIFVTPKNNFRAWGAPNAKCNPTKLPSALDQDARKEIENLPT